MARGGVSHNLADLVLGEVTAVAAFLAFFGLFRLAPGYIAAIHSPGSYLGEQGIFVNLDTPAVVVGEVEMELVELVQGHHVQVFLHFVDAEEMAAHIQVAATPFKTWVVGDFDSWNGYCHGFFRVRIGRCQLEQRLETVEQARFRIGGNQNDFFIHRELVAFIAKLVVFFVIQFKNDDISDRRVLHFGFKTEIVFVIFHDVLSGGILLVEIQK